MMADQPVSDAANQKTTAVQPEHRLSKPLLIFDGNCGFCRRWIRRWQAMTGERVDYAPYQAVGERFPQISQKEFETATQLVEPDGRISSGAEAVFRSLATVPGKGLGLWFYQRVPGFAPISRAAYRFVAGHRRGLSSLTKTFWGSNLEPSTFDLSRRLFIRLMGVVYLIAFASLAVQVVGLVGKNGITPIAEYLPRVYEKLGTDAYWSLPTLCWFDATDEFLKFLCWGGVGLASLLVLGLFPIPMLVILWVFYLSLTVAGGVFLRFQWDILLLEAGFLAIFFAPLSWRLGSSRAAPPSGMLRFLVKWLLFRLMFLSGLVKLTAEQSIEEVAKTWSNLTALNYHYETQPIPTWASWYAHQLPDWFQKCSVVLMFAAELVVPFLLFGPRRIRHAACAVIIGFMALVGATGNYNFFNLLTVSLCIPLLDDAFLRRFIPARFREWLVKPHPRASRRVGRKLVAATLALYLVPFGAYLGYISSRPVERADRDRVEQQRKEPVRIEWMDRVLSRTSSFHFVNSYGLFRVMTRSRPEIVIEGSNDGRTWLEYEFPWKPGDLKRRPAFVEPHQPRLDWQMWFAALGRYERNPWFAGLMRRLLEGSPSVLALLEKNPFPDAPPRYLRATLYDYHFTSSKTRSETGAWWRREFVRIYREPMSLTGR